MSRGGSRAGRMEIATSPEAVWRLITTFADIPTWYDDWDRCEHDPGQTSLHEGARFRLVADRGLRARVAECHIVSVDQPTLVRWIEHRRLRAPVLVEFRLDAVSSRLTGVTHSKMVGKVRRSRTSVPFGAWPPGPGPRAPG